MVSVGFSDPATLFQTSCVSNGRKQISTIGGTKSLAYFLQEAHTHIARASLPVNLFMMDLNITLLHFMIILRHQLLFPKCTYLKQDLIILSLHTGPIIPCTVCQFLPGHTGRLVGAARQTQVTHGKYHLRER